MMQIFPTLLMPQYHGDKESFIEVLNRLQCYAQHLAKESNWQYPKLVIVISQSRSTIFRFQVNDYPNLDVLMMSKFAGNIFSFSIHTICLLRRMKIRPRILIAGDPWKSFISCWLVSFFVQDSRNIQYQVHGDPFTNSENIVVKLTKKTIFYFAIRKADSIRVVSEHLKKFISEKNKFYAEKTFIAPIPIQITDIVGKELTLIGLNIGYVGRLHPERGTDRLIEILELLYLKNRNFYVKVIGDGPDRAKLVRAISSSPFANLVEFLGRIPNSEIAESYKKLNCLLVCAPEEGYGLSIREAVTQGVFVVALENTGTLNAHKVFPESVSIFKTNEEAAALLQALTNKRISSRVSENNYLTQKEIDEKSISVLVNSWIY
jgi:glycosyltransferase involved in cell wall biosynthesis